MRFCLAAILLGGCLSNPTVEVDTQNLDVARGTHDDVLVYVNGDADLDGATWSVDDAKIASVARSEDGVYLQIRGEGEGKTMVRVSSHGQDFAIATRVGPPAIVKLWTEPARIDAQVGSKLHIKALVLDTVDEVHDISFDSRWQVRDTSIVSLDASGMLLSATSAGETTIHVGHHTTGAVVPVTIFQ